MGDTVCTVGEGIAVQGFRGRRLETDRLTDQEHETKHLAPQLTASEGLASDCK